MISLQLINLQLSPERIIMYNHYFFYNSDFLQIYHISISYFPRPRYFHFIFNLIEFNLQF